MADIKIRMPSDGDHLLLGTNVNIYWSHDGIADNQSGIMELLHYDTVVGKIPLSSDMPWHEYIPLVKGELIWNVGQLNSGSIGWIHPTVEPGFHYRIRIKTADETVLDVSDDFIISYLKTLEIKVKSTGDAYTGVDLVWVGGKIEVTFEYDNSILDMNYVYIHLINLYDEDQFTWERNIIGILTSSQLLDGDLTQSGIRVLKTTCDIKDYIQTGDNYQIIIEASNGYKSVTAYFAHPITVAKFEWLFPKNVSKLFADVYADIDWRSSIHLGAVDLILFNGDHQVATLVENWNVYIPDKFGFRSIFMWNVDPGLPLRKDYYVRLIMLSYPYTIFDSERFIICPSEIPITSFLATPWRTHWFRYWWGFTELDTHGSGPIEWPQGEFGVGFINRYYEWNDVFSGGEEYIGEICRGYLVIEQILLSTLESLGISYDICIELTLEYVYRSQGETTQWGWGSAAQRFCVLNTPLSDGEFRSFDQNDCYKIEDVNDWMLGAKREFRIDPNKLNGKYGIIYIGPNESMLWDPESNHNNDAWLGGYSARVYARINKGA